jgi:hypothetical protein
MIPHFDFKRLCAAFFCSTLLLLSAFASAHAEEAANVAPYADMEKKWGVRPVAVLLSAGGYMLDFRYHVSDAEKAAPLFSRQIKPYIIDQSSGAKFFVPETAKVGALRQTRKPYPDKNYFIIFGNPAKYVKKGSKVTVVIGDLKIENLTVE